MLQSRSNSKVFRVTPCHINTCLKSKAANGPITPCTKKWCIYNWVNVVYTSLFFSQSDIFTKQKKKKQLFTKHRPYRKIIQNDHSQDFPIWKKNISEQYHSKWYRKSNGSHYFQQYHGQISKFVKPLPPTPMIGKQ